MPDKEYVITAEPHEIPDTLPVAASMEATELSLLLHVPLVVASVRTVVCATVIMESPAMGDNVHCAREDIAAINAKIIRNVLFIMLGVK